jgi:cytochrome P450
MPIPNIPADFDFLDPDVNLAGLPVVELAELRTAEPIHWVDIPGGTGGFEDKGYWIVSKHADVKEVSKRSDVFSSWLNGAIPTWPPEMKREQVELQRSVMLNMDAPHHTRKKNSASALRTLPRPRLPRVAATSSSRCRANCPCKPSRACSVFLRTIATSSSAGPTR